MLTPWSLICSLWVVFATTPPRRVLLLCVRQRCLCSADWVRPAGADRVHLPLLAGPSTVRANMAVKVGVTFHTKQKKSYVHLIAVRPADRFSVDVHFLLSPTSGSTLTENLQVCTHVVCYLEKLNKILTLFSFGCSLLRICSRWLVIC